jgi:diguanylate cyclase (GGDEF)-like protein
MTSGDGRDELKVLIVDDDKTTRLLATRALDSAGFSTLTASDGHEALAIVRLQPDRIGAMVLDILLPTLSGFQVLAQLKQDERTRDIPVVLLTAKANAEADVVRGIEVGADDHVQKPFSDKVLSAKVRALCERRAEGVQLAQRLRAAEELAATDALTGLGNRRAFETQLSVEIAFSKRHRQPLSLLLLDIDHFKAINDEFGHPEGDRVLTYVAERLIASLRASDQAYRLGGEEFGVLLRECAADGAKVTGDRILRDVGGKPFVFESGRTAGVMLSGGIAVMGAERDFDASRLFSRADKALYRAKEGGRGRVLLELFDEPPLSTGPT